MELLPSDPSKKKAAWAHDIYVEDFSYLDKFVNLRAILKEKMSMAGRLTIVALGLRDSWGTAFEAQAGYFENSYHQEILDEVALIDSTVVFENRILPPFSEKTITVATSKRTDDSYGPPSGAIYHIWPNGLVSSFKKRFITNNKERVIWPVFVGDLDEQRVCIQYDASLYSLNPKIPARLANNGVLALNRAELQGQFQRLGEVGEILSSLNSVNLRLPRNY